MIVIALLFVGGIAWEEFGLGEGDIRTTIRVDVNERMVGTLRLGGPDCDMSGYDLIISSPGTSSTHARENLGSGRIVDSHFCQFTIHTALPERDEYTLRIETHSGDTRIAAKTVAYDDVFDGDRLAIKVRWFNHRDAD